MLSVPTVNSFLVREPEPLKVRLVRSALPEKLRFPEPLITPLKSFTSTFAVILPEPLRVAAKLLSFNFPLSTILPDPLMVKLLIALADT
ncbi:hypothetical protein D9M68_822110 [compost metagenome]